MKKLLLVILLFMWIPTLMVQANGVPYLTFTYSQTTGRFVYTQDAYVPLSRIQTFGDIELDRPTDIAFDAMDQMYISDRNLGYIIRYNEMTQEVVKIGEGILKAPTGVHIGFDGHVYVSDFELKQAFKFVESTRGYELDTVYEKPLNSPFFGHDAPFDPTKIVTDKANNVYVLLAGNVNGLAQYKNDGTFFGYFGGNQIPATWQNIVTYLLFDETTRRNLFQIIPDPIYNIAIDDDGLLLTTTQGQDGYKKLNIANFVYNQSVWGYDDIEDIIVTPYETILTVTKQGRIVEYGPDGSVLFIFSGYDSSGVQGLFESPTGIATNSNSHIYVVDERTQSLQIFIPTSFANLVHQAIDLYQEGRYVEALQPWQQVLEQNALFDLANQGLGDAYFAEMDYENALYYYEIARDRNGYSDAFWEVRNDFLLDNGTWIVSVIAGLILLVFVGRYIGINQVITYPVRQLKTKLKDDKWYQDMTFSFYMFKHPIDGYYGIKREGKGSVFTASIYYALFFILYLIYIFETSFIFNDQIPSQIDIMQQLITVLLPMFLFVGANYLVSSIRDGEGKLKDIYIAMAYNLLPLMIGLPILTLISNGLTLNEAFIMDMVLYIMLGLFGFYMIMMIKEIHYYELKATISNILITLFTGLMLVLVVFVVYLLLGEVVTLILDIIREVTVRG
jgi:tetratricopeptide (TPR) repeat protein